MDKNKKRDYRLGRSFSLEERKAIVEEYLRGTETKAAIWERYSGQTEDHGRILGWIRQLGYLAEETGKLVCKEKEPIPSMKEENPEEKGKLEALSKRVRELEKQLEGANLKLEGYELMIYLAEQEYKISIRKKSDAR